MYKSAGRIRGYGCDWPSYFLCLCRHELLPGKPLELQLLYHYCSYKTFIIMLEELLWDNSIFSNSKLRCVLHLHSLTCSLLTWNYFWIKWMFVPYHRGRKKMMPSLIGRLHRFLSAEGLALIESWHFCQLLTWMSVKWILQNQFSDWYMTPDI